uniref:Bactericidal permeability-increasing protein n=1 Tax=Parascaris univalens TaxID=6257 RepID=A0A915BE14_PARUN
MGLPLVCTSVALLFNFLSPCAAQTVALSFSEYEAPSSTPFIISLLTDDPAIIGSFLVADESKDGRVPAGIYFRISQKGIDYITSLASQALPQLLEKSVMPTVEQPQIKISKLTIEKFAQPTIEAKFIDGAGISAHVHLPQVMMSAIYDASTFFTTYKGKFKADVENLTVIMEVYVSRNETANLNIIETPICNVTSTRIRIVFAGDMSTYLNLMRSLIEQTVIEVLGSELCQISVRVAHFFEQQKRQILMTTPAPRSTPQPTPIPTHLLSLNTGYGAAMQQTTPETEKDDENAIYEEPVDDLDSADDLAAKFAADLCANDRVDGGYEMSQDEQVSDVPMSTQQFGGGQPAENAAESGERPLRFHPPPGASDSDSQRFNPLLVEGVWAPDLTLMYAPKFTNKDVMFGLDGGIVFYGEKAKNVSRPSMLNISALGDQMFGLLISEYVPNTFFAHVYDNGLGTIRESFRTRNLPKFIKPIAKLLCSTCELQLIANLTARPQMRIDLSGVRLDIEGDVAIVFLGKTRRHEVVTANTKLDITVKPFLKHSRVYGDVALTSVDIQMKNMGVSGMFANSLKNALNAIIPKKLWPKIKKRLRFALNQRGIKLPVMCGVELERPSLSYVDHAIVINTDFSYDLPRFISKFKAYINAEVGRAKKKQQLEDEEEYDGLR